MTSTDSASRQRFFDAGTEALLEDPFRLFEAGLPPDVVARKAQRSRRTFYDHFGSKSDFVRAMLISALDSPPHDIDDLERRFERRMSELEGDFVEIVNLVSRWTFSEASDPSLARMQLVSVALATSDPEVNAALAAHTDRRDDPIRQFCERSLRAWGMQLRPPWTPQSFATVLRCLGDGLFLRSQITGEDDERFAGLLSLTLLSLVPAIMQAPDSSAGTIGELIRAHSADATRVWRESHEPAIVTDARSTVLEHLDAQLGRHGYHNTSLADVAAAAGLSATTIRRAFGDLDDLIAMVVDDRIPFLESEVGLGLESGDPPLAVAERHVQRLARMIEDNRVIFRSVLAMTYGAGESEPAGQLLTRLSAPLERCLAAAASSAPPQTQVGVGVIAGSITQTVIALATVPAADPITDLTELSTRVLDSARHLAWPQGTR